MDDIENAAVNTPAGTLTDNTGATMNCKVLQSIDCSGHGPVGDNEVTMYVVCDPGI